jgi:hypothetical protein
MPELGTPGSVRGGGPAMGIPTAIYCLMLMSGQV